MSIQWKRFPGGIIKSADGRFVIKGHWATKPGYYSLADTKTNQGATDPKLKVLKARAELMVVAD